MNEKFVKLMMLTTSSNDHEALSALRKANQILACKAVSWEQLIKGLKNVTFQVEAPPREEPRQQPRYEQPKREAVGKHFKSDDIDQMFEAVLGRVSGGPREFIESIFGFYRETGFLTDKQFSSLEKFYANTLNRRS
jgi:hypothetical protein